VPQIGPQSGSFEELAMPFFDQLYNFAHRLTHNYDEAEDLVEENLRQGFERVLVVPAGD
jgi:DNA-directed RNA polymerase specialized sigma24 family protein